MPSKIDIAGNKLPQYDHLGGGSFKKVAFKNGKGRVKRNNDAIVFHVPYENGIALKRAHSAIIVDNFKLLKFYDNNQLMLFELNSDYGEKNDLSQVLIEKTKTLEATLEAYLTKVKAPKWQPGIHWKSKSLEKINSFH